MGGEKGGRGESNKKPQKNIIITNNAISYMDIEDNRGLWSSITQYLIWIIERCNGELNSNVKKT